MFEYTWEILSLYTAPHENGLDNVVKRINWRFQVTEGHNFGDFYSVTELTSPSPDNYIQYSDLTEETIINWIKLNRNYDEILEIVHRTLEENKNPKIIEKNPPWDYPYNLTGEEEYLVVIDDQPNDLGKIWGPLMWDSGRINRGLKERGITDVTVPDNMMVYRKGLLPIDSPLILNDRAKIYRVDYAPQPTFDEIFEYKQDLSWITDTGRAVGTYFVYDKTVDQIKTDFKEIAKQKRNQKLFTPSEYLHNGKKVLTYTDAQTYLLAKNKADTMSNDETFNWKLGETWILVTKNDLINLSKFINTKIQEYYDEEYSFVVQVENCETVDDLRNLYRLQ